jgi:hypothetical protein
VFTGDKRWASLPLSKRRVGKAKRAHVFLRPQHNVGTVLRTFAHPTCYRSKNRRPEGVLCSKYPKEGVSVLSLFNKPFRML